MVHHVSGKGGSNVMWYTYNIKGELQGDLLWEGPWRTAEGAKEFDLNEEVRAMEWNPQVQGFIIATNFNNLWHFDIDGGISNFIRLVFLLFCARIRNKNETKKCNNYSNVDGRSHGRFSLFAKWKDVWGFRENGR